jgi:hypothetical protein
MQVIKILLLSFSFGALFVQLGFSQVIRENEKGEKIIVYPDGSWQYFNLLATEQELSIGKDPYGIFSDSSQLYPVFTGLIGPMDNPMPATEQDAQKIAFRNAQLALEATRIANEMALEAKMRREELEKAYQKYTAQPGYDPLHAAHLKKRLEAAQEQERLASKDVLNAYETSKKAEDLTNKGNLLEVMNLNASPNIIEEIDPQGNEQDEFFERIKWLDLGYLPYEEVKSSKVVSPPEKACEFAFEDAERKDLKETLLFVHTDERLRPFLKGKDYLKCEAYLSQVDGAMVFLTLQFTFAYPNAREAYGFIEKGSILTVELLSGEKALLRSQVMDGGRYNIAREELTYNVHYPIDPALISTLKNSEIGAFTVFWSSGYERYEAYQVDFFSHQINCLEN